MTDWSPLKQAPSAWTHLFQQLFHCQKHLSYSVVGISKSCSFVSTSSNNLPLKVLLIRAKRIKSHWAISGEYGGRYAFGMWCLAKDCCTSWAVCNCVLSWCICHAPDFFVSIVYGKLHDRDALVLLNRKAGLQYGHVECIHGTQYRLNSTCTLFNLISYVQNTVSPHSKNTSWTHSW